MTGSSNLSAPASDDRSRWTLLLRALFWLTLLAVLTLATMPNPPQLPTEPSDKIQHFTAFLCLMLLGSVAYPRLSLLKLAIGLAGFGALIEGVQAIPTLHRDSDWLDWVVDVGAAISMLAALVAWRWLRRKS
jgi:hypothetical protein